MLWVISSILFALFLWISFGNLWISFRSMFFRGARRESLLPLVGGILGALAIFISPMAHARKYWWIALLTDIGCGPMLFAIIIDQVFKKFRR